MFRLTGFEEMNTVIAKPDGTVLRIIPKRQPGLNMKQGLTAKYCTCARGGASNVSEIEDWPTSEDVTG
jgi:hypothetical protein